MGTEVITTQQVGADRRQTASALGVERATRAIASGGLAPIAVAAYIVLAPVIGSFGGFEVFNGQRVLQLLVLGVATASLLFHEARARWLQAYYGIPGIVRIGLVTMLALGCVSAARAPLPRFAFLEVALFALLFVVMVALASQAQRDLDRANSFVLIVLAAGASVYALSFAIGYLFSLANGLPVWPHAFTGFAHVRMFNQYQVWTLPLLVLSAVLVPGKYRGLRFGLLALVAMWYALLYASGGRGAVLALAGSLVLTLVLYRKRALPWVRLQLAASTGGLVLYVLLFVVLADNLSVFTRLQQIGEDSGRFELWAMAWDMVGRHPLLGEGPMQFARHLNEHASHPHNAVLQWASEWGVPSLVILLGVVGWGLAAWVCAGKREMEAADHDLLRVAMTATMTAAAMYALVDGVTVMPLSQFLLVAIVGWVIATFRSERPAVGPHRPGSWTSGCLHVVVLVAWLGVGYGVFPDVTALEELQAAHVERTRPELLHPRFWQQGFIEP